MSSLASTTRALFSSHRLPPPPSLFRCAGPFISRPFSSSASPPPPTIFAPATGRGKAAISILRISGPDVLDVWHRMTKPPRGQLEEREERERRTTTGPRARRASLRRIVHPETGEVLDEGVVLFFPANSALTAQPTLELHTHGSPALMALLLRLLPTLSPAFRIAEPGEFTRLAFEAGKMDLTEVEGIRDLVDADTEAQRKLAARQAGGYMRKVYDQMRASVIEAMSLVEALIDFGEDEGISDGVWDQAKDKVATLRLLILRQLDDGRRGEIIRTGIRLAIIGPPNAGKSTLLNWFAQREAAIVTSTPGTTRDVIEVSLNFHDFPLIVADTAGLRETSDEIEAIGVQRAKETARGADIKLFVLSLGDTQLSVPGHLFDEPIDANTLVVLSKADLSPRTPLHLDGPEEQLVSAEAQWAAKLPDVPSWVLSVKDGTGMAEFTEALTGILRAKYELSDDLEDTPVVTHARHRRHLEECVGFLDAFLAYEPDDIVLAAEELRYATQALGRITGAVDVEEVLGEIFRGFCIGK